MAAPAELPDVFGLDVRLLFDATPVPHLVLRPDFTKAVGPACAGQCPGSWQHHSVSIRHDAIGALDEACTLRPDALILDIGLPDMDGYELSRRLHALPETRDALFIALTGYGQAHDKVLAKAAGFAHYFVKPVDLSALHRALAAAPVAQVL